MTNKNIFSIYMGNNKPVDTNDSSSNILIEEKTKPKKPSLYQVLILNDDYTPMEFVVLVLERFFGKNNNEATQIMYHVHQKGMGVCGIYPYEIAETKVVQVMDFAKKHQHPLQCTLEKE
jgi:ATP-dependent Clp protease adaptor protein ClpS